MLTHRDRYARRLAALKHPGNTATIDGMPVKREALRYVIGDADVTYAYNVDDAVADLLARTTISAVDVHCGGCSAPVDPTEERCGACGFPDGAAMLEHGYRREDTTEIVLTSQDVDCDGIGYAWRRVSVPDYLATRLLDYLDRTEAARKLRREAQQDMHDAMRAGNYNAAEIDGKRADSHDADAIRESRAASVLADVLLDHCRATDQFASGDWYPLSRAEARRFLADLDAEGDAFDRDYWRDEGYHSTFNAR